MRHGSVAVLHIRPGKAEEIGGLKLHNDGAHEAHIVVTFAERVQVKERGKRPLADRVRKGNSE